MRNDRSPRQSRKRVWDKLRPVLKEAKVRMAAGKGCRFRQLTRKRAGLGESLEGVQFVVGSEKGYRFETALRNGKD